MHPEILFRLVVLRLQVATSIFDSSEFWIGFAAGLLVAFVIGFISQHILIFFGPVLSFFKKTKSPATNQGPSPADVFVGCVLRLIVVSFAVLVLFVWAAFIR
jgi:hypothetical protein